MDIQTFLKGFLDFLNETLIPFVLAIGFLAFVWNATRYFIFQGSNEESQEKAKSLALYSVLAFVIIGSLWGIVNFIVDNFKFTNNDSIQPDYMCEKLGGDCLEEITDPTPVDVRYIPNASSSVGVPEIEYQSASNTSIGIPELRYDPNPTYGSTGYNHDTYIGGAGGSGYGPGSGLGYADSLENHLDEPETPSGFSGEVMSGGLIELSWDDESIIEWGFHIDRSTNDGPWVQFAQVPVNATRYRDYNVVPNQTYRYRIAAFNNKGESGHDETDLLITATAAPPAPTLAVAQTGSGISLSLTSSSMNELGFSFEYSSDGATFTEIGTTARNVLTYTDRARGAGTHYYRARAFNNIGNSTYSPTVSVVVQ